MARLPDAQSTLAVVERIVSAPTAPYHEWLALRAIEDEMRVLGIPTTRDDYGQLHVRLESRGAKKRLAFIAHTDHPAFDTTAARGREGRARVRGGFYERLFAGEVRVNVHDDGGGEPYGAVLDDWTPAPDIVHNSLGDCRVRAERDLRVGQFAVVDVPAFETQGDVLRLRAAVDLALCAVIVLVLATL